VPLKDELEYINNYIGFEKLRISDRLVLQTDIATINDPRITIAPMVLIVFIENAFKHAGNTLTEKVYIDINLLISGKFIEFSVKNSFSDVEQGNSRIQSSCGLGLSNTIRRLNLLYERGYELNQYSIDNFYNVQLRLKIKHV